MPLDIATVTALAMSLATTWFAIILGFASAGALEWLRRDYLPDRTADA